MSKSKKSGKKSKVTRKKAAKYCLKPKSRKKPARKGRVTLDRTPLDKIKTLI